MLFRGRRMGALSFETSGLVFEFVIPGGQHQRMFSATLETGQHEARVATAMEEHLQKPPETVGFSSTARYKAASTGLSQRSSHGYAKETIIRTLLEAQLPKENRLSSECDENDTATTAQG